MRRFYSRDGVSFISGLLFLAFIVMPLISSAETHQRAELAKFGISEPKSSSIRPERSSLRFIPLSLKGGTKLTLISPVVWSDLADELLEMLGKAHAHYTALFGEIPPVTARVRLMDEEEFFTYTGAPAWTNAMYYRGEVLIPLATNQPIDLDNLHRSVKHEYTHAVISALTAGKAPGWLDEGLAQWAEGTENPNLGRVLRNWLLSQGPVPLRLLQGGFTKLDADMVPAAYAQSLFSAHAVLNSYGLEKMTRYFRLLREGSGKNFAFEQSFGVTEAEFELSLAEKLGTWSVGEVREIRPVRVGYGE